MFFTPLPQRGIFHEYQSCDLSTFMNSVSFSSYSSLGFEDGKKSMNKEERQKYFSDKKLCDNTQKSCENEWLNELYGYIL